MNVEQNGFIPICYSLMKDGFLVFILIIDRFHIFT